MDDGLLSADFASLDGGFSLVPGEFSGGTDVPFIDLLLVTLGYGSAYGLSHEPGIREFFRGQPWLYEPVRALGAAVAQAGLRARDTGQLKNSLDDNIRYYSPDELWCFDLATDMVATLAMLPGVDGGTRFRALDAARSIGQTCTGHWFHKELKHATAAPAAFSQLRSLVPSRTARA